MLSLCSAAAITVGMHIGSYHTFKNSEFNNVNPGVYVAYNSYVVGTYKNSLDKQTVYAGKVFDITENCRYDVMLGAATGYNVGGSSVIPFIVPSAKFNIADTFVLRTSVIPQVTSEGSVRGAVFHASIQKTF